MYQWRNKVKEVHYIERHDKNHVITWVRNYSVIANRDMFSAELQALGKMGKALFYWIQDKPRQCFYPDHYYQLGFSEIAHESHQLGSTGSEIKHILFADGSDPKFRTVGYYGSHRLRGGRETFWLVSFFTVQINEPLKTR